MGVAVTSVPVISETVVDLLLTFHPTRGLDNLNVRLRECPITIISRTNCALPSITNSSKTILFVSSNRLNSLVPSPCVEQSGGPTEAWTEEAGPSKSSKDGSPSGAKEAPPTPSPPQQKNSSPIITPELATTMRDVVNCAVSRSKPESKKTVLDSGMLEKVVAVLEKVVQAKVYTECPEARDIREQLEKSNHRDIYGHAVGGALGEMRSLLGGGEKGEKADKKEEEISKEIAAKEIAGTERTLLPGQRKRDQLKLHAQSIVADGLKFLHRLGSMATDADELEEESYFSAGQGLSTEKPLFVDAETLRARKMIRKCLTLPQLKELFFDPYSSTPAKRPHDKAEKEVKNLRNSAEKKDSEGAEKKDSGYLLSERDDDDEDVLLTAEDGKGPKDEDGGVMKFEDITDNPEREKDLRDEISGEKERKERAEREEKAKKEEQARLEKERQEPTIKSKGFR